MSFGGLSVFLDLLTVFLFLSITVLLVLWFSACLHALGLLVVVCLLGAQLVGVLLLLFVLSGLC